MDQSFPAPGEAPQVAWEDVPPDCRLIGLAPIGVPWGGRRVRGKVRPNGRLVASEFAVTHAVFGGVIYEVKQ